MNMFQKKLAEGEAIVAKVAEAQKDIIDFLESLDKCELSNGNKIAITLSLTFKLKELQNNG